MSYILLHGDIRSDLMRLKHAIVSFLILTSVLPDILCMSEINVSSNTALLKLYLGIAPHWFSPKMLFRSALCVAICDQKNLRIRL